MIELAKQQFPYMCQSLDIRITQEASSGKTSLQYNLGQIEYLTGCVYLEKMTELLQEYYQAKGFEYKGEIIQSESDINSKIHGFNYREYILVIQIHWGTDV